MSRVLSFPEGFVCLAARGGDGYVCVCAPPCLGGGDFVSVWLCISVFVRTCVCFFTLKFVYRVERVSVRGSLRAFVCVSVCVSAFLCLCVFL